MKRLSFLIVLCLAALLGWMGVGRVQAHAMLMRSIPEENASLDSAPAQVELFFSEAIDAKLSKISVMDMSNRRMDLGDSQVDPADATHLMVTLPKLGNGVYMVVWSAVSAADGHQTVGSFPFAVGTAMPASVGNSQMMGSTSAFPPAGVTAAKVILYLATTAILGGILFAFLVWQPSLHQAQIAPENTPPYCRFLRRLFTISLWTLVGADLFSLFAQAGQVNGALIGWPWQSQFFTVLLDTRFGVLAIARLALALVLAGLLLPRPNRWNRWTAAGVAFLLLLTFSLESHAAAEPRPLLPVLFDWLHFAAISVWVGGLFAFLGGMSAARQLEPGPRTQLVSYLIPHFTVLAFSSVGVMGLTGLYSAYLRIGTPLALVDTSYGVVMLVKLVFILPMLALGGSNFLFTTPVMRRAAAKPGGSAVLTNRFHGMLAVEAGLGMAVLVIVGVFTGMQPARAVATSAGFSRTVKANDLQVLLNVNPGQATVNTFTATVLSSGKPVTNASDVSIEFSPISGMTPMSKAPMVSAGNGVYTLKGGYLAMPDQWNVKVVVTRPGKFDAYAMYQITTRNVTQAPIPWRPVAAGLLGLAALGCAFAALAIRRPPVQQWRWA